MKNKEFDSLSEPKSVDNWVNVVNDELDDSFDTRFDRHGAMAAIAGGSMVDNEELFSNDLKVNTLALFDRNSVKDGQTASEANSKQILTLDLNSTLKQIAGYFGSTPKVEVIENNDVLSEVRKELKEGEGRNAIYKNDSGFVLTEMWKEAKQPPPQTTGVVELANPLAGNVNSVLQTFGILDEIARKSGGSLNSSKETVKAEVQSSYRPFASFIDDTVSIRNQMRREALDAGMNLNDLIGSEAEQRLAIELAGLDVHDLMDEKIERILDEDTFDFEIIDGFSDRQLERAGRVLDSADGDFDSFVKAEKALDEYTDAIFQATNESEAAQYLSTFGQDQLIEAVAKIQEVVEHSVSSVQDESNTLRSELFIDEGSVEGLEAAQEVIRVTESKIANSSITEDLVDDLGSSSISMVSDILESSRGDDQLKITT